MKPSADAKKVYESAALLLELEARPTASVDLHGGRHDCAGREPREVLRVRIIHIGSDEPPEILEAPLTDEFGRQR